MLISTYKLWIDKKKFNQLLYIYALGLCVRSTYFRGSKCNVNYVNVM